MIRAVTTVDELDALPRYSIVTRNGVPYTKTVLGWQLAGIARVYSAASLLLDNNASIIWEGAEKARDQQELIERVKALHKPIPGEIIGALPGSTSDYIVCPNCYTEDGRLTPYPCPTVAALTVTEGA